MGAEPPETGPPQGFDIDDRELDQFIADWGGAGSFAIRFGAKLAYCRNRTGDGGRDG